MKIINVEVIPLSQRREPSSKHISSKALFKIETNEGIIGWGEASDCGGHSNPMVIKQIVDEELKRHFVGEDPLEIPKLMFNVQRFVYRTMGLQGAIVQALSGVEIALWDIVGKVKNESISKLFGRYRDKIEIYAAGTIGFDKPLEWHIKFFEKLLEKGVKTVKVRIGNNFKWDLDFVKGVRELLCYDINLIVDACFNYTANSAIKMAKKLSEYDILYFEEPIPQYDINGISKLVSLSHIPIAYGEHTNTIHGFKEFIERKAADVLTPDVTIAGGLLECQKIAAMAEAWNLPISTHSGVLSAVGITANLHFSASIPNFTIIEFNAAADQPLRDELLKEPILALDKIENGCLTVPNKPGLGIEIDERTFEKYRYVYRDSFKPLPGYASPHI